MLSYQQYVLYVTVLLIFNIVGSNELPAYNIPKSPISICNIPKVPIHDLLHYTDLPISPMIFIRDSTQAHHPDLIKHASRQNLLSNYGDTKVTLTSSNAYSHGQHVISLYDYIVSSVDTSSLHANETWYLFGNNYDGIWRQLSNEYMLPKCPSHWDIKKSGAKTLGLGGKFSGVSFHFHGSGFSESIIGRKRWFLLPPDLTHIVLMFNPNMTVTQWVDKIYPRIKQYQAQNEIDRCYANIVDNNHRSYDHIDRDNKSMSSTGVGGDRNDEYDHHHCHHMMINNNNNYSTNEEIEDISLTTEHLHSLANHLYECELNVNEVLYFPSMWMHATLNIDEYNVFMSVFIDTQLIKR